MIFLKEFNCATVGTGRDLSLLRRFDLIFRFCDEDIQLHNHPIDIFADAFHKYCGMGSLKFQFTLIGFDP